jgi:hypothetical protein
MAAQKTMTPADALGLLPESLTQLDADRLATLQFAQQLLGAKARTVQNEPDTPLTTDVTQQDRLAYFQGLSTSFGAMVAHEQHFPVASDSTYVLFGRVEDAQGQPLPNYQLALENVGQAAKGRISSVRSDAQGYFSLTLRVAEFPNFIKNKTPIFLTITDPQGREVFTPTDPLQMEAGKITVFTAVDTLANQKG